MNYDEITSLIKNVARQIESNEKLALPILAAKARREAAKRPDDTHLVNASQVLTKMASTKTFISKSELRNIVERFGATHSKLSSVFSDELGKAAAAGPKIFERSANEGVSVDRDYERFADPVLSNALSGLFEANPVERIYSASDAQRAQRAVHAQLSALGLTPKEVSTFAGRNDVIICQASHETPRGRSNTLVPVEMVDGKALLPVVFLSRGGFKQLDRDELISHVKDVAGRSFKVDASRLLDSIDFIKNGSKEINEVELAAIKVASQRGMIAGDPNAILYTKLDEVTPDVQLPKLAATEESSFAEKLGKPDGVARFIHGDKVVEAGRSTIVRKFADFGYSNVQVKVASVDEGKIHYAVGIASVAGMRVPIDVEKNRAMPPKVVFANGIVAPFEKEAIANILRDGLSDNRALASTSPCYDMKPSELVDVVRESVAEGNYLRAEDAINVLGEKDPEAQKIAIASMAVSMSGNTSADIQKKASEEVKDTPYFMSYKIFFPEGV
jgi:hypothetical protein